MNAIYDKWKIADSLRTETGTGAGSVAVLCNGKRVTIETTVAGAWYGAALGASGARLAARGSSAIAALGASSARLAALVRSRL